MKHINQLLLSIEESVVLDLASFFHDAIYVPGNEDNEDLSEAMFQVFNLETSAVAEIEAQRISDCILKTKAHISNLTEFALSEEVRIFLESDLLILAAKPERYLEYSQEILKEYTPMVVDESEFRRNRSIFLKLLLAGLKKNQVFQDQPTNQIAISNILAEIHNLLG